MEDPAFGKVWARNLTPDVETGLGKYHALQIKQALRDARLIGKRMAPPMALMLPHHSRHGRGGP